MAVTLIEAAKSIEDDVRRGFIELYASSTNLLRVLPFETISGDSKTSIIEGTPGRADFRLVNAGYTEGHGTIQRITDPLVIRGGDVDVDTFIEKTGSGADRSMQEAMKTKRLGHLFTQKVFKGDQASSVAEFNGLQARLDGTDQEIINGANGAALSLAKLDEALDLCVPQGMGRKMIFANQAMVRRFKAALRPSGSTPAVLGDVISGLGTDAAGIPIQQYGSVPIITIDDTADIYTSLPFTETEGGSSVCTSIYVVAVGEGDFYGIQSEVMDVRDMGELQTAPALRTRIEWFAGVHLANPRAAVRISGITDAAIAA